MRIANQRVLVAKIGRKMASKLEIERVRLQQRFFRGHTCVADSVYCLLTSVGTIAPTLGRIAMRRAPARGYFRRC
eukprot:SAG11_NODE_19952_length_455_cov_2.233146_1_plen_75_part_10